MAQFSKFKLLFRFKLNFNGGQFHKEILKFGYSKSGKSHNKVGVAEEIGCKKCLRPNKLNENLGIKNHVPG